MSNKNDYEHRYQRFVKMWERNYKVETIAKKLGVRNYTIAGDRYYGKYVRDHEQVKYTRIDSKKMMDLIHQIERKYHVGDYVDGVMVRFSDNTIPEDEPLLIELRRVVNKN